MEVSLFTVAPAPISPQPLISQSTQATDEGAPFTAFLSKATRSVNEDSQEETDARDSEASESTPNSPAMFMTVEQTTLSLQNSPELHHGSRLTPGNTVTTTLSTNNNASPPVLLSPDELNQLQTMLATTPLNKNEPLLTQQLQSILTADSQATLTIRTSYEAASAEPLNGLSSPHIQSADSSPTTSLIAAHAAIKEGTIDGTKATDTGESVRQNVEELSLNANLDGLADKNSTHNQRQDTGKQESGVNQQNAANAILSTPLSNNEQTGQSFISTLGAQTTAPIQSATSTTHSFSLSHGAPVDADAIINNLVERFSTNPRLQTSKISLNLNPAELGALKIDILVKGDSIKAHIAVNSQQIQETIEKNMPRLRAILEQQGFNIEDFQVSMESTTSDSNHFFQQQFSSRHDSMPQTPLADNESAFDLSLSSAEANTNMNAGINLSI